MAIVVETGSIVAGANSYVDSTYLTTYATERGITISGDATVLLYKSTLYIEQLSFKGDKKTKAQPMQWPRVGVLIDGFYVDNDEIPQLLKDLQCEVAIAIGEGDDPLGTIDRAVKREKVDAIEVEYADNAAPFALNRKIKALEAKLTRVRGGGMVVELFRA